MTRSNEHDAAGVVVPLTTTPLTPGRRLPTPLDTRTRLLTVPEVASHLAVDPSTVRRWIAAGELEAVKVGRHYRVELHRLDQLLDQRRTYSRPLTDTRAQVVR